MTAETPAYGTPPAGPAPAPSGPGEPGSPARAAGALTAEAPRPQAPVATVRGPAGPPPVSPVAIVRAVGILVAVGMVALGVADATAQFFRQREDAEVTITAPVTRLVTDTGTGDVTVHIGAPGQPTVVRSTLRWSFHRPTLTTTPVGGVLTLRTSCTGGWIGPDCSVDLDVTVPPGSDLDLSSGTGTVTADAPGSAVSARTGTGDVQISGVGPGPVKASTGTGDVTVRGAGTAASVEAATSTGDVKIDLTGIPSSVSARTATGDIDITVPGGTGYHVVAGTRTGEVDDRLPRDDTSTHLITARSSTGDVTLHST